MTRTAGVGLLVVMGILATPGAAGAYYSCDSGLCTVDHDRLSCAWTPGTTVNVRFNAASFGGDGIFQSKMERQVIHAIDSWNQVGGDVRLKYDGRSTAIGRQSTYINLYMPEVMARQRVAGLVASPHGWCDGYGGSYYMAGATVTGGATTVSTR